MGFLLMYDITNEDSFSAVQDWATQIKTYSWDNAQVVLVGNKSDLEEERVVPTEGSRQLANELGFHFFEASAKDNVNVRQAFERLVDVIYETMNESADGDQSTSGRGAALQDTPPDTGGRLRLLTAVHPGTASPGGPSPSVEPMSQHPTAASILSTAS
ncbi:hypothetical protein ANANG_G00295550 [Anguilla anguilla]|uniref:small monomeric GTPase n=1 Tax=Anguilla anguilla TaxID=7936 RepID=A0A9D3LQL8_ANGAN|nr:hypothetical protein ANANG_G00295550 [Anguilla anguilla]